MGAIAGNQVGQGRGNTAATVGGAIAGGVVGNEVEKRTSEGVANAYRIRVRLDNGNIETYTQDSQNSLRVGDRVRVTDGRVSLY